MWGPGLLGRPCGNRLKHLVALGAGPADRWWPTQGPVPGDKVAIDGQHYGAVRVSEQKLRHGGAPLGRQPRHEPHFSTHAVLSDQESPEPAEVFGEDIDGRRIVALALRLKACSDELPELDGAGVYGFKGVIAPKRLLAMAEELAC